MRRRKNEKRKEELRKRREKAMIKMRREKVIAGNIHELHKI